MCTYCILGNYFCITQTLTKGKELLGHEVPYLSAIGALMYLANCTRLDISFSVNLLYRYNFAPTQRHWNSVKHILCYLQVTAYIGLLTQRNQSNNFLDMLMQDTFQIHIKLDHKQGMCLIVMNYYFMEIL